MTDRNNMQSKIEEPIVNDSNPEDLSLAEETFRILQIHKTGFNPKFFTNSDLLALALTSKTLGAPASGELRQRKLAKLLTHVVRGEQEQALAIIKENPDVLMYCSEAIDYSGRTIRGTAFQAALGAGDKPMWEMMLPHFESLKQGEALRQFHEQFPKGIEDDVSAVELKDYYNALALAIIKDEDHGLSAIERFRKEITSKKEVTQGKHFNLQNLLAAYQAYIDNFNALANWDNRDFFWQKVIGYVQRQMSAYDAQILCSGVKSVLNNENSFKRDFKFSNNGESFFPLNDDSGIGFDFACTSRRQWGASAGPIAAVRVGPLANNIKELCGAKTNALAGLRESLEQGIITSPINCF